MPGTRGIDPDLTVHELMSRWPATIGVFVHHGMMCVGCQVGPFHTVRDACREYDLDEVRFWEQLRAVID